MYASYTVYISEGCFRRGARARTKKKKKKKKPAVFGGAPEPGVRVLRTRRGRVPDACKPSFSAGRARDNRKYSCNITSCSTFNYYYNLVQPSSYFILFFFFSIYCRFSAPPSPDPLRLLFSSDPLYHGIRNTPIQRYTTTAAYLFCHVYARVFCHVVSFLFSLQH